MTKNSSSTRVVSSRSSGCNAQPGFASERVLVTWEIVRTFVALPPTILSRTSRSRSRTPRRSKCPCQGPLTGADKGTRAYFENTRKCRFLVNCICTRATGSRPPEHETCAHDAAAACGRMPRLKPLARAPKFQRVQSTPLLSSWNVS